MIKEQIVLILGAGASWDYGFPTGARLKAKIWEILLDKEFYSMSPGGNHRNFKRSLELTPDLSIDAFLEHNFEEFGEVGKAAIARVLLPYEKEANLFGGWMQKALGSDKPADCDIPEGGQHWYSYLFNKMSEGCTFDNFKDNKLAVVTFNYDRSFEWFMLQALSAKYQKKIEECKEVLNSIPVIHIYGQLGNLLPENIETSGIKYDLWSKLDLGGKCTYVRLAAKSIKIIHEKQGLENLYKSQQALLKADRIYFLGFGYHMTNMEKLFLRIRDYTQSGLEQTNENLLKDDKSYLGQKCYGTAYGLSPHQRNQLEKFGLNRMSETGPSIIEDRRIPCFADATIYDFLLYNYNSKL